MTVGGSAQHLFALSLALPIVSAAFSLVMFAYGVTLSILQPRVLRNSIIRVMIVVQLLNCLRFIFRILLIDAKLRTEASCRVILFMSEALSLLPVNLCVHCVLYLQLVVIHKLSSDLRWPRALILTTASVISLVPPSFVLYFPPHIYGKKSACTIGWIPNRKLYNFFFYAYGAWAYLSGGVGLISVTVIAMHLVRTRRATRRALQSSAASESPSLSVEPVGPTDILSRTLLAIVWFPITPIISLWFNAMLVTISYHKQRLYKPLEVINLVLLCLQSVLLGVPLLMNPLMRAAFAKQLQEQRLAWRAARPDTRGSPQPLLHSVHLDL
ncbi:hypothetical protein H4R21_000304 [Coemansia helicoidea]|uniref:Uncharacterized protein n=1 Tax=Coemansia helicoidea TaxID=1286919 RepID=A0ACC1LFR2_9FUNG|nr:hypothetical protein H4R21_000304 [Coemansia helicoidea]